MTKTVEWTVGFLAVTFAAVAMEIYSVVDGRSWTRPWTDLIVGALPAGVGIPLVIGFASWLCVHFISRWLGHPLAVRWPVYERRERVIFNLSRERDVADIALAEIDEAVRAFFHTDQRVTYTPQQALDARGTVVRVKDILVGMRAQRGDRG